MVTNLRRLARIVWVIGKYRLDEFIPAIHWPLPVRLLLLLGPWRLFPATDAPRGERLRKALEELGPIFVKFGQILSTRRDLLPDDIADELKHLQDRVPPFDSQLVVERVERELKQPISQAFAQFETSPLASASVAQVHAAELKDGSQVVVKVIRPGIETTIRQDIALMRLCAGWLERWWQEGKRLHPLQVVQDYEQTIVDELDLLREAANASQLRRNFEQSELLYVPAVHWPYCSVNLLVLERVYGIPVAEVASLRAQGTNMRALAEAGVEIFFTQVFQHNFFHADMHPGNIFVSVENPERPKYIAIDFGIVGSLTPQDQLYIARNLLAFFNRDYHEVAMLHIDSGWVPEDTPVNEFEAAIRTCCEPIFERPLSEISFGHLLLRLFQTARRFNMEVQPQLVLLQKTLLNIEGLGRQLYPQLDLWSTAQPFLERWMRQRMAPQGVLKEMRKHLPDWLQQTPEMPQILYEAFNQIRQLDRYSQEQQNSLRQLQTHLDARRGSQRDYWLAAIAVGAALISSSAAAPAAIAGLPATSWALLGVGLVLLVRRR